MLYIGIDLGTSSVKLLLVTEQGRILNTVTREYPLSFPQPGWSEQNPEDWWNACVEGLPILLRSYSPQSVGGIGIAGQMHSLVILDKNDRVIRPAILWNDGRADAQTDYLNREVGENTLARLTANIAFAGFTAPKLLWLKKHEPSHFDRICKLMLPKDYINYKLTGIHGCDYSDASGTLLLNVREKQWSEEMLKICAIHPEQMPRLFDSHAVIGTLSPQAAALLGLPDTVKVAADAGDNAAAAVGTGTVGNAGCNISLGTSGTLFISTKEFMEIPNHAIHSFAHADGGYHLMGCMLSAASCNKWLCEDILRSPDFAAEQAAVSAERLGKNSVCFIPYLMGERSPINDPNARSALVGMSLSTTRADLVQAVLEGVAFALRDSFEIARALSIPIAQSTLCGGGAKSPLWRKVLANVLGIPMHLVKTEQGPGFGAAMLAMVACGEFANVTEAARALVKIADTVWPEENLVSRYQERYERFGRVSLCVRGMF